MKKLLTLAFMAVFMLSNAQMSFNHAAGAKLFIGSGTLGDFGYGSVGVVYSPRLNLVQMDNATVSFGTHFGLAFESSSRGGSSYVYDIPLVAEYNFGFGSSEDADDGFGFYVGGGYGIHGASGLGDSLSGPVINGGVRFVISERPLDLHFSYLMANENYGVIGIGLQYMLGMDY